MNMHLTDSTFRQIRDFIYEKSGIFICDTKKYLIEKKLVRRIEQHNLGGFDEYLSFLRYSVNGTELEKLFDVVTTNETYFFREPRQLSFFIDTLVPNVLARRGNKEFKVWSAASSTGEEPYTLALLLKEKHPGLQTEILASDISTAVLEAARKAVYGSYSVRNVAEPYLSKYFRKRDWTYELDDAIKKMVKFTSINLIDERKMRAVQPMDVIFCRNVLIYFDDCAKQKSVSLLYDALRPGGYLLIGSSESLHNVTRAFKPVVYNKVVAYEKV